MINLNTNNIELTYFTRILREINNNEYNNRDRLLDSFSSNQIKSKIRLIEMLDSVGAIREDIDVTVFGCWYNSVLGAALQKRVRNVYGFDIDPDAINQGLGLFEEYDNVFFTCTDVFSEGTDLSVISESKVIINPSCEHMRPMSDWPYWRGQNKDTFFAFQSNNMFDIPTHINCVHSLEEFKSQLPKPLDYKDDVMREFRVLLEDELADERGTRFTIIGKIHEYVRPR